MLILDPRWYISSAITGDKVSVWHPFKNLSTSSIVVFLFFLICINKLSNKIASVVKQNYLNGGVCTYISITWIGDLQIQLD